MDRDRFEALLKRCCFEGADPANPGRVFDEVARRYAEPHRRYHTARHIRHCLEQLDLAAGLLDERDAVEMALWFHDVVWEARAAPGTNERESAELFVARLGGVLDEGFRDTVHRLVMVTVYPSEPATPDEGYMVDIDLSSFGLPWEEFRRDSQAVRDELPHLSDEEFFPKQHRFLRMLLGRERFFVTDFFAGRYERAARDNIERLLRETEARPAQAP